MRWLSGFRARKSAAAACGLAGLAGGAGTAWGQDELWLEQIGTSRIDEAVALTANGAGGAFVGGYTLGDIGGVNVGGFDAWFGKYDAAGTQAWTRQIGTDVTEILNCLAGDGAGGTYIAGNTRGDLNGVSAGGLDAWMARYDGAGNEVWLSQFGTVSDDDAIALIADGTGAGGGTFAAGFSAGALGSPNAGGFDAWIGKFDGSGIEIWMRQFGTGTDDVAFALASDGSGGAFVAGETLGSLAGANAGIWDVWLARYDDQGSELWVRQFGTSTFEEAMALAEDGVGGAYVAGWTRGRLGNSKVGGDDAWLARYDDAGNRVWIEQFGTLDDDRAQAVAPDGSGGVYVAGYTSGSLSGASAGSFDVWMARYDSDGNQVWLHQFGTTGSEIAYALAADDTGGAFVAGLTEGDLGGPNAGLSDAWIARFGESACYADCDQSTGKGVLDVFDFLCFQNGFVNGEAYACDCDTTTGIGVCDVFDFLCFQNAFVGGCQ